MDAAKLLREAREAAFLSQAALASAADTAQSAVCAYERGTTSPTVRTLNRLLAAAGKQLRCSLEPYQTDLDERVDAMIASEPVVDVKLLEGIAERFENLEGAKVTWAFDGTTALGLHGFGVSDQGVPCLVLQFDEAARRWMTRRFVKGTGPGGPVGWHSADVEEAQNSLGDIAFGPFGMARLRVVEALPPVLDVLPKGGQHPIPVLTIDEVEHAHPALGELLARWRERREGGRRTVV